MPRPAPARDVWFILPSANADHCRRNLPAWRDMGYRVAVLEDEPLGPIPADRVLRVETYRGWSASVNRLCREAVPADAPLVVAGGDDMLPDPNHRAAEIAEQFFERFPDGFGVMQPTGDDFLGAGSYCGSPWLGRRWIETMYRGSGPMFDGYLHNRADHELRWVADAYHALWFRDDLSQYHDRFDRRGEAAPGYWSDKASGAAARLDMQLFLARRWMRFPGCEPIGIEREFDHTRLVSEDGEAEANTLRWHAEIIREVLGKQSLTAPSMDAPVKNGLMATALRECRRRGLSRVGVYPAGSHTVACRAALAEPPVEIVCLIDDHAEPGQSLYGHPIVTLDAAASLGLDAVVLSSDSVEDKLWDRTRAFRERGCVVTPLYGDEREYRQRDAARPVVTAVGAAARPPAARQAAA